jgi:tetratricopeptide (TPR) repeat protein
MIVADDAEGLERTLASVGGHVDEIVVCDTGSDESVGVCAAAHGAHVVVHPWCDSFAAARNECLRHVNGRWILWLDARETMMPEDIAGLRGYVEQHAANHAGLLLIKIPPLPGSVDGEQIARIRLVPHQAAVRFEGRVRESPRASLAALQIPIEGLPYRIYRGDDEHDAERRRQRARRNIELADMELRELGWQPRLANCLAEAFHTLQQPLEAATWYRQTIDRAPPGSPELLEAFYGLLTLEGTEITNEARLKICAQAMEAFPVDMQLLCALGGYLQTAGRWDLALRAYETAYRFGQINPEVWHVDQLRAVAAECFALSLQLQGRMDEATCVLEGAEREQPASPRLCRQLLEAYIKQGRRDEALALVNRAATMHPQREALRSAVRGACLAAKQNWISARAYLQVAYQAGCRDPICFRWLTTTLAATGEAQQARELLIQWSLAEPHSPEPRRLLEALAPDAGGASEDASRQLRVDNATHSTPGLASHAADSAARTTQQNQPQ